MRPRAVDTFARHVSNPFRRASRRLTSSTPALFGAAFALVLLAHTPAPAQTTYRKPPQAVLDVLNAPVPPSATISPARDQVLLATGVRYPPITELAQPMLRLAGLRINPNTSAPHMSPYYVALSIKRISDEIGRASCRERV